MAAAGLAGWPCSRGGRVPPAKLSPRPPTTPQEEPCMGSQPTLDPAPTRPPDTGHQQHRDTRDGQDELLEHLQTPAARGGHEFGDWPLDQIANGFGGDLAARHRHDHTRLTPMPVT